MPLAWNLNRVTGVQPLQAVTVSLLHWFSGASCQMAFCLKLQLDLFIERIGCTGDFRSKYKCSSCPSLLRFVEARGLKKTGENRWRSIGGLFFTSFDTSHDSILVFISFLPLSYPLNRLKWLEIATRDQERLQLQMRQVKFNLFQYSPRYRQSWFQPIHLLIFRSTPWYHRKPIKHA